MGGNPCRYRLNDRVNIGLNKAIKTLLMYITTGHEAGGNVQRSLPELQEGLYDLPVDLVLCVNMVG